MMSEKNADSHLHLESTLVKSWRINSKETKEDCNFMLIMKGSSF